MLTFVGAPLKESKDQEEDGENRSVVNLENDNGKRWLETLTHLHNSLVMGRLVADTVEGELDVSLLGTTLTWMAKNDSVWVILAGDNTCCWLPQCDCLPNSQCAFEHRKHCPLSRRSGKTSSGGLFHSLNSRNTTL